MKTIILVQGTKGSGKSAFINNKFKELERSTTTIQIINEKDPDTIIYILRDIKSGEIIILNSGSNAKKVINNFGKIIKNYPDISVIYTTIRPPKPISTDKKDNELHHLMINTLNIKDTDSIKTYNIKKLEFGDFVYLKKEQTQNRNIYKVLRLYEGILELKVEVFTINGEKRDCFPISEVEIATDINTYQGVE